MQSFKEGEKHPGFNTFIFFKLHYLCIWSAVYQQHIFTDLQENIKAVRPVAPTGPFPTAFQDGLGGRAKMEPCVNLLLP